MPDILPDTRFARSPHTDATLAGDRAAIYHRETRKAITLNPVGTVIWQALESPKSLAELRGCLVRQFAQVEPDVLESDLRKFMEVLVGHSLVVYEG